jgi:uncharacterized protein with FMN-binding domain
MAGCDPPADGQPGMEAMRALPTHCRLRVSLSTDYRVEAESGGVKMKVRRLIRFTLLAVLALAGITGCKHLADIKALQIADVAFSDVKNGTYESLQDNGMVTAKVSATMVGGVMTELKLLQHNHGPGHGADAIIAKVLDKQSLAVDAVAGATYSSKVVLKAIETALDKGL